MSTHAHSSDKWDDHATKWSSETHSITYEPCMTLLKDAEAVLPFNTSDSRVLDNGSGSGQLTGILKSRFADLSIVASDISGSMISTLEEKADAEKWSDIETAVQDSQTLQKLDGGSFSHVFCTFVISFMEHPESAIQAMYRVLRPGGVVGISAWKYVSWVSCWESAVHAVMGNNEYKAPALFHEGTMSSDWMKKTMVDAGFTHVKVDTSKVYQPERGVQEAMEEFYGGLQNNPSILLLMKGFDEDFKSRARPHFESAFREKYDNGKRRQFEEALMVIGRKESL